MVNCFSILESNKKMKRKNRNLIKGYGLKQIEDAFSKSFVGTSENINVTVQMQVPKSVLKKMNLYKVVKKQYDF